MLPDNLGSGSGIQDLPDIKKIGSETDIASAQRLHREALRVASRHETLRVASCRRLSGTWGRTQASAVGRGRGLGYRIGAGAWPRAGRRLSCRASAAAGQRGFRLRLGFGQGFGTWGWGCSARGYRHRSRDVELWTVEAGRLVVGPRSGLDELMGSEDIM